MSRSMKYTAAPLLFSIYPVIFLYAHNIELVSLSQLTFPLVFAFILAVAVLVIFRAVFKDMPTASIAATGFVIVFWNYEWIYKALTYYNSLSYWHILPVVIFLYSLVIFFFIKLRDRLNPENINKIITIAGLFLIVFNLLRIVPGEIEKYRVSSDPDERRDAVIIDTQTRDYPDIYLLIFDEYARLDTISEGLGYDISGFKRFLEDEGFFLAEKSSVKTLWTSRLMPERLNLRSLDKDKTVAERIALYYKNYLFYFLHQRGYEIKFLDGWMHPLGTSRHDFVRRLTYGDMPGANRVSTLFMDTLVLTLMTKSILQPLDFRSRMIYYYGNSGFFNILMNPETGKDVPELVYAHIMCPHLPYVFDRDGSLADNIIHKGNYRNVDPGYLLESYLDQYIYVTGVIKKIIVSIKENNPGSVIIIQSDHGLRNRKVGLRHGLKVFNAVYFPDGDYSGLYDSISPVDTLRVFMNRYFGENFYLPEEAARNE